LQSLADVPLVLDALLGVVRAGGFGDPHVFGIRLALEEAIRHRLKHQTGREGSCRLRLRYHLGGDGLLVELEDEETAAGIPEPCCEQSVGVMRHFMTEVRLHEEGGGITLYKRRPA